MNTKQARDIGSDIARSIQEGDLEAARNGLLPILNRRTPFRFLDIIGQSIGECGILSTRDFLDEIASMGTEGGWVVIGTALRQHLGEQLETTLERSRRYIIAADVWYGSDIIGERVPGPALVDLFQPGLKVLGPWRDDQNQWVRRSLGVAIHFWAKRSQEDPDGAAELLSFLESMFEEWNISAAKGIGWGLKTLGKHYPDLVARWLREQAVEGERKHRAVVLRKAITYLPMDLKRLARGED